MLHGGLFMPLYLLKCPKKLLGFINTLIVHHGKHSRVQKSGSSQLRKQTWPLLIILPLYVWHSGKTYFTDPSKTNQIKHFADIYSCFLSRGFNICSVPSDGFPRLPQVQCHLTGWTIIRNVQSTKNSSPIRICGLRLLDPRVCNFKGKLFVWYSEYWLSK